MKLHRQPYHELVKHSIGIGYFTIVSNISSWPSFDFRVLDWLQMLQRRFKPHCPEIGDIPIPLWIKTIFFLNKHNMMISLSLMLVSIPTLAVIFCLVLRPSTRHSFSTVVSGDVWGPVVQSFCQWASAEVLHDSPLVDEKERDRAKAKKSQERPKCIGKQFQDIQDDF